MGVEQSLLEVKGGNEVTQDIQALIHMLSNQIFHYLLHLSWLLLSLIMYIPSHVIQLPIP